jgi:hypothetical protein
LLLAGFDSEGPGSGPAICSPAADATRNLLGYGEPVQTCGAFGAFNKRSYDLGAGVGTPGANEAA